MIFRYRLEVGVFLCGAIVMIFELVGSRILGPYFGTSVFIWTSIIGVILGSLSLGYYYGGIYSDKSPNIDKLSRLIMYGAFFIILTFVIKDKLLIGLDKLFDNVKFNSVISSIILFSPSSLVLGMISPYAVKLKVSNLDNSGAQIGSLYAISTFGSIFGTFLCGFYLIPAFGTNKILLIIAFVLVIVSIFFSKKDFAIFKIIAILLIISFWFLLYRINFINLSKGFIDIDTAYNRVWIYDTIEARNLTEPVRRLMLNNEYSSAMYVNNDKIVSGYINFYNLAKYFKPDFKKTVMFGGAGYSYPKYFIDNFKDSTIDVVEIDQALTQVAKKYFRLKDNPRMKYIDDDARVFINNTKDKYDVIYGDAFSSHHSLPFQLTTKEAIQKEFDILNEDGVAIVNIISSIEGDKGEFLRAEYRTYKSVFPNVYIFSVNDGYDGRETANIILVASKRTDLKILKSSDSEIDSYLKKLWKKEIIEDMPIITDDYAPIDYYIRNSY